MGMDIRFGLIYGIEVWNNLLEDKGIREVYKIPIYDKYTGKEKGFESRSVEKFKLLKTIIGLGSAGDLIREDDFHVWIISKRNEINNEDDNGNFIYDYDGIKFFGIKAFTGEEPYLYPQNYCFELNEIIENAAELFDKYFPYLFGLAKPLMYMRVSV
jgi:hypothetical protein